MITKVPYEKLIDFIAKESNKSVEEIESRIKEKLQQFSNMISKEGAAILVAGELNIDLNKLNELTLKVEELIPGTEANVKIKVLRDYGTSQFIRNDGSEGQVKSFLVGDETGTTRLVLWNDLIDRFNFEIGKTYEIKNAKVRKNREYCELHLQSSSEIQEIKEEITIGQSSGSTFKFIKDVVSNNLEGFFEIFGIIVQVFEPRFFYVCPECKRRVEEREDGFYCYQHGVVDAVENYMCSVILDDTTETIRIALFREVLDDLLNQLDLDLVQIKDFENVKKHLLGVWCAVEGKSTYNPQFDRVDFVVRSLRIFKNPNDAINQLNDILNNIVTESKNVNVSNSNEEKRENIPDNEDNSNVIQEYVKASELNDSSKMLETVSQFASNNNESDDVNVDNIYKDVANQEEVEKSIESNEYKEVKMNNDAPFVDNVLKNLTNNERSLEDKEKENTKDLLLKNQENQEFKENELSKTNTNEMFKSSNEMNEKKNKTKDKWPFNISSPEDV